MTRADTKVVTPLSTIKVIVSDLYGVNLHRSEKAMLADFMAVSGLPAEDVSQAIKASGREALKIGTISPEQYVQQLNLHLGSKLAVEQVQEIWNRSLRADATMVNLLHRLQDQGYLIVLLSNLNAFDWLDGSKLGLAHFDNVLSYTAHMKKPDPRIFHLAMAVNGLAAASHLYIDDQQKNVDVAKSLGMEAVLFTGYDDLLTTLADFQISPGI